MSTNSTASAAAAAAAAAADALIAELERELGAARPAVVAPVFAVAASGGMRDVTPMQVSHSKLNVSFALLPLQVDTGGGANYYVEVTARWSPGATARALGAATLGVVREVCGEFLGGGGTATGVVTAATATTTAAAAAAASPPRIKLEDLSACERRLRACLLHKYAPAAVYTNAPPLRICQLLVAAQRERLAAAAPAAAAAAGADIDAHLPASLRAVLKSYQREAVRFAVRRGARCLIADEMGLGKTLEAIAVYRYMRGAEEARRAQRVASVLASRAALCSSPAALPVLPTAPLPRALLIVCPSSLRVQWGAELCRWLPAEFATCVRTAGAAAAAEAAAPGVRGRVLVVMKASDYVEREAQRYDAIVVSYELASKLCAQLARHGRIGTAIVDESHMLKNASAQRTRNLTPLLRRIDHVVLLSGTPALARPKELYAQLAIVAPQLFPVFHDYGVRYCAGHEMRFTVRTRTGHTKRAWDYSGASNVVELNAVLRESVMVRRRKEDVLGELPSKLRERIYVDVPVSKALERKMDKARKAMLAAATAAAGTDGPSLAGATETSVLEAYQAMAKAKVATVCKYVEEFAVAEGMVAEDDGGGVGGGAAAAAAAAATTEPSAAGAATGQRPLKILLFAHHRVVLDALEELVRDKLGLGYVRIDGSVAPARRAEHVQRFQDDERCRVALLSIMAAGTGLTLTRATVAIFAELNWTPGILAQCEARAHRIGQSERVVVQYLIGKDTVEEDVWAMLERKIDVVGSVIDGSAAPTPGSAPAASAADGGASSCARKRHLSQTAPAGASGGGDDDDKSTTAGGGGGGDRARLKLHE